MRKTLATIAILALLAVPMIAFAGQAQAPLLTGTPEPKGEPKTCPEGAVTVVPSAWECEWIDTSFEYDATFHEAVTEKKCPEGYPNVSQKHPGYCYKGRFPDWPRDYKEKIEVEVEPAYFTCDQGGELKGESCYVEQGEWDCGWTDPECARPTATPVPEPSDDPSLRIGGRCTDGGDSQEIGFVFDDGDYDGARLIITRQDGVEVANEGEGSGFFPARAAVYGWKIVWFNGQTREQLDAGRFEVNKCELPPTATPEPQGCHETGDKICPGDDDPEEHPGTGADPNTALSLVTALTGFALAGVGGAILFVRRRASS